jgi:hypothetical protein
LSDGKFFAGAVVAFVAVVWFLITITGRDEERRRVQAARKASACITVAQEIQSRDAIVALGVLCE